MSQFKNMTFDTCISYGNITIFKSNSREEYDEFINEICKDRDIDRKYEVTDMIMFHNFPDYYIAYEEEGSGYLYIDTSESFTKCLSEAINFVNNFKAEC